MLTYSFCCCIVFQSTLPREERLVSGSAPFGFRVFQSTLPREERQCLITSALHFPDFNPRSHERSDGLQTLSIIFERNFNPRSHERSDRAEAAGSYKGGISIHAPTRGATVKILCNIQFQIIISIHAPTRGATQFPRFHLLYCIFQSTLPREERR